MYDIDFSWEQSFDFITLKIPFQNIAKKDIKVVFNINYVEVYLKNQIYFGGPEKTFLRDIYIDGSVWYLDDNILIVECMKTDTREKSWWPKLFNSDPYPQQFYVPPRRIDECSDEAYEMMRNMNKNINS